MDYVGNRKVISGVLLNFFLIIFEKDILRGGGVDFLGIYIKKELTYKITVSFFLKIFCYLSKNSTVSATFFTFSILE